MNQFFYETRGKEKVKELMDEGMRSQALRKSGEARYGFFRGLPKLILILASILGFMSLIAR